MIKKVLRTEKIFQKDSEGIGNKMRLTGCHKPFIYAGFLVGKSYVYIEFYVVLWYNLSGGTGCPLRKGVMPMYVTYEMLFQIGTFIVALIGLVYKICRKDKK